MIIYGMTEKSEYPTRVILLDRQGRLCAIAGLSGKCHAQNVLQQRCCSFHRSGGVYVTHADRVFDLGFDGGTIGRASCKHDVTNNALADSWSAAASNPKPNTLTQRRRSSDAASLPVGLVSLHQPAGIFERFSSESLSAMCGKSYRRRRRSASPVPYVAGRCGPSGHGYFSTRVTA